MAEKVLMKGNEAIAESAIRSGCLHYFGYPITPQTEVAAYMAKRMPKIGGVFLQAESEISAINMVYGVAATGKRVMTSSSSPGISLKQEGISYIQHQHLGGTAWRRYSDHRCDCEICERRYGRTEHSAWYLSQ